MWTVLHSKSGWRVKPVQACVHVNCVEACLAGGSETPIGLAVTQEGGENRGDGGQSCFYLINKLLEQEYLNFWF